MRIADGTETMVMNNILEGDSFMRSALRYTSVLVVLALLSMSGEALAQGNRLGTAGADQLLVPVGARGVALGSSYLAGITGVDAIYYNPAGLSGSTAGAEVMFSQMSSFDNDGVSYLALGANFAGFGHIGLSLKSFSFADIPITDERNPDGTGGVFNPAIFNIGLTYSRALTDRIRAGVTAYLISETLNRVSTTGMAFDIGVQYNGLAGAKGLELGVTLRHLGGNMSYDGPGLYRAVNEISSDRTGQLLKIEAAGFQLPTSLELGLAYKHDFTEEHKVMVSGSFENNNFLMDQYRIGAEYGFRDMFFVRGSYTLVGNENTDAFDKGAYIFGPAFGAGVRQDISGLLLAFDYAYRSAETFSGNHIFTLKVGF